MRFILLLSLSILAYTSQSQSDYQSYRHRFEKVKKYFEQEAHDYLKRFAERQIDPGITDSSYVDTLKIIRAETVRFKISVQKKRMESLFEEAWEYIGPDTDFDNIESIYGILKGILEVEYPGLDYIYYRKVEERLKISHAKTQPLDLKLESN